MKVDFQIDSEIAIQTRYLANHPEDDRAREERSADSSLDEQDPCHFSALIQILQVLYGMLKPLLLHYFGRQMV
jgi:hypothetical protein